MDADQDDRKIHTTNLSGVKVTLPDIRISTVSELVDNNERKQSYIGIINQDLSTDGQQRFSDFCVGVPNFVVHSSVSCPTLPNVASDVVHESGRLGGAADNNNNGSDDSTTRSRVQISNEHDQLDVGRRNPSCISTATTLSKPKIVDASETSTREENIIFADDHNESFLLTIIPLLSLSTGLAALLRMPFLMLRHGGAIFLVPYTILILLVGMPLSYLEMALGQFSGAGIYRVWNCLPKFKGLSYSTVGLSFFISIYYSVLSSWTLLYVMYSMNLHLPWKKFCVKQMMVPECSNYFNNTSESPTYRHHFEDQTILSTMMAAIGDQGSFGDRENDTSWMKSYGSPQQYFFTHVVLKMNDGLELSGMGSPRWGLLACCLGIWLTILIWQLKRFKTLSRNIVVASVRAFSPMTIIIFLLILGFTRPGIKESMKYFFGSEWSVLLRSQIWFDAMSQVFFGLGATTGVLINTSSYRDFSNNCSRDSRLLVFFNYCMAVLVGVTAFLYLGASAEEYGLDLEKTVVNGPGAMVVLMSYAVTKLSGSVFFSILIFVLLTIIGGEQLKYYVETVKEFLAEKVPAQWRKWRIGILTGMCLLAFLLSLLFTFDAGIYIFTVIDSYLVSWQCMTIGFIECVGMSWIYGVRKWAKDLEMMEQRKPSRIWEMMWKFVTPFMLTFVLVFSLVDYVPVRYNGTNISIIFDTSVWVINVLFISIIPITYFKSMLRERRVVREEGTQNDNDSNTMENGSIQFGVSDEVNAEINTWGTRLSRAYESCTGYSGSPVVMVRIDPDTNIPYGYFIPPGKKVLEPEASPEIQEAIRRNLANFGRRREPVRDRSNRSAPPSNPEFKP